MLNDQEFIAQSCSGKEPFLFSKRLYVTFTRLMKQNISMYFVELLASIMITNRRSIYIFFKTIIQPM